MHSISSYQFQWHISYIKKIYAAHQLLIRAGKNSDFVPHEQINEFIHSDLSSIHIWIEQHISLETKAIFSILLSKKKNKNKILNSIFYFEEKN